MSYQFQVTCLRTTILLIYIFILNIQMFASETRLQSMGKMTYSVPDIEAQVNLFQVAGNIAGLKTNDTTNWMYYSTDGKNDWGSLRRHWDAHSNQNYAISFSGLKHLGAEHAFYGFVSYDWDYRQKVNNSIEPDPYSFDPFVFADYTEGNFLYHGPKIVTAYNYQFNKNFFIGTSLQYYIGRGLKDIETEPEIVSRKINASLDLIYQISDSYHIGLSFMPYQYQDVTKLVQQQDGLVPTIRRYRGEFIYREKVTKSDRTAKYTGYNIRPQFSFNNDRIDHVAFFNYYYQWHNIFDIVGTKHINDGYFQAQHYSFQTVNRIKISELYKSFFLINYKFETFNDWAKLPDNELLFYKSTGITHEVTIGGSSKISILPLIGAIEIHIDLNDTQKIDYLAHKDRSGAITELLIKTGFEYHLNHNFDFRLGYIYHEYYENEIWNYYGDYNGSRITFGSGWRFDRFELDTFGEFGLMNGNTFSERNRTIFNVILKLKQYF